MNMKATVSPYPGGKYNLSPLLNSLMVEKKRHLSGFGGMGNEFLCRRMKQKFIMM